jgi:hypothetical protein
MGRATERLAETRECSPFAALPEPTVGDVDLDVAMGRTAPARDAAPRRCAREVWDARREHRAPRPLAETTG